MGAHVIVERAVRVAQPVDHGVALLDEGALGAGIDIDGAHRRDPAGELRGDQRLVGALHPVGPLDAGHPAGAIDAHHIGHDLALQAHPDQPAQGERGDGERHLRDPPPARAAAM